MLLRVTAPGVSADLKPGDSININGACQTIIETREDHFAVEAVEETLKRTNLGQLKKDDRVNLELALRPSDRLGGHLVTGHVDFVGVIKSVTQKGQSFVFEFGFPGQYESRLVEKGSVAVDGISLTVVEVLRDSFTVSVIPFTMSNTTLRTKRVGDTVNIESDLVGKYIERVLTLRKDHSKITEEWLKEKGW